MRRDWRVSAKPGPIFKTRSWLSKTLLACVFVATYGPTNPAWAGNSRDAPVAAPSRTPKLEDLRVTFAGARLTPRVYWRIGSDGKGEVSMPASVGYQPLPPLIAYPVFQIAPGVHHFDIGTEGYRELGVHLSRVTDAKHSLSAMHEGGFKCAVESADDAASLEIAWSDNGGGMFRLPDSCLTDWAQDIRNRMLQSWHVLAGQMHARGHAAVTVKQAPVIAPPRKLNLTESAIWTQNTIRWQINADGGGWFEVLQDGNLPTADPLDPIYVRVGRYDFQIGLQFQQAVLRELEPYMKGSTPRGSCEDELTMSDQPIVHISWVDSTGARKAFDSDLGCPSFAARMLRIKLAFAELLHKSRVGDAVLLK